jgi:hypothetical protein
MRSGGHYRSKRRGLSILMAVIFFSHAALPATYQPQPSPEQLNLIYQLKEHVSLSATGRNILQPHRQEFAGNNSDAVGFRCDFFGTVTWTW